MKVKQQTVSPRPQTAARRSMEAIAPAAGAVAADWTAAAPITDMIRGLDRSVPTFATRVPGRLDVMGGSAAHTGAFSLGAVIDGHAYCVAQPRSDGRVVVTISTAGNGGNPSPITMSVADVAGGPGADSDAFDAAGSSDAAYGNVVRCVLGAVRVLAQSGTVAELAAGVSVIVATTIPTPGDFGGDSALFAAVTLSAASAYAADLATNDLSRLLGLVGGACPGLCVSASDMAMQLQRGSARLVQVDGLARSSASALPLPDGTVVVGVNCRVELADALQRYERMRTAACMGRAIIARIINHEKLDDVGWEGRLSRVSSTDYVGRFRDRIPTKLIGAQFLEHFGDLPDGVGRVDPNHVYKVRSRTEHHIYEHERSLRFGECIARAARTSDASALTAAGQLMYGSHWSYGQRCGLSSIESDLLVNLIRRYGQDAGVWGAKCSGRACGGVISVLLEDHGEATSALQSAMEAFQQDTQSEATLISLLRAGGEFEGVRRI